MTITTWQSLPELELRASREGRSAAAQVAGEFEAMILAEMLNLASKPLAGQTLLDGGSAGRMSREMFFSELASQAARGGGLGLAAQLEREMQARQVIGTAARESGR